MIYYVLPSHGRSHSIDEFLGSWGSGLKSILVPLTYDEFYRKTGFEAGTYIFTQFEALGRTELAYVVRVAGRMAQRPELFRILNCPDVYCSRLELLDRLYARRINRFRAFQLGRIAADQLRYPVFIRSSSEHVLWDTRLLIDAGEFEAERRKWALALPHEFNDFLAIEYEHSADEEGMFRKYSAMRIGDRIVPRHVLFSRNWATRFPDIVDEQTAAEEAGFVKEFPHRAQLEEFFKIADIDYGRIDYTVLNGAIHVWEINTNPVVVPSPARLAAEREISQRASAESVTRAFEALERGSPASDARLSLSPLDSIRSFGARRERRKRNTKRRMLADHFTYASKEAARNAASDPTGSPLMRLHRRGGGG